MSDESTGSTGEVQLDNGVFRVTKWTIEPDGVIPMHKHDYEYVVVPMVTDTMRVRNFRRHRDRRRARGRCQLHPCRWSRA